MKPTGLQKVKLQKEQAQTMPVAEASHLHFAQEPSIQKKQRNCYGASSNKHIQGTEKGEPIYKC